jgi:hypothetical protein
MKNYIKSLDPFRLLAFMAVAILILLTSREFYRHYTIIRCTEKSVGGFAKLTPDSAGEANLLFELPYRACMGRAGLDANY